MKDYLLLKNVKECPKCRDLFAPTYLPGQCRKCGMQLFKHTDNIKRFEHDTGWREYWVYMPDKGWMHRTQIFGERPLPRIVEDEVLEDDYGTQDYVNRKIDNSRIELKEALKKTKKKPTFKKVYK